MANYCTNAGSLRETVRPCLWTVDYGLRAEFLRRPNHFEEMRILTIALVPVTEVLGFKVDAESDH